MQIMLMFVVALAVVSTQDPPQDQTLTGCLRTGSSPTVLLLRSASLNADATSGPRAAEDYLLVSAPASLSERVNHRIAVTGVVSDAGAPPPPPPAANAAEKALKKLSVKDVKEVAANCSASSR